MISCSWRKPQSVVLLFSRCQLALRRRRRCPRIAAVPSAAKTSPNFNAEAATNAWMAESRYVEGHSDAYSEGGTGSFFGDFLYGVQSRWSCFSSAGRRPCAIGRKPSRAFDGCRPSSTSAKYILLNAITRFPSRLRRFLRRASVRLATQTFGPWDGRSIQISVGQSRLGAIIGVLLLSVVRCFRGTWWIWVTCELLFVVFIG